MKEGVQTASLQWDGNWCSDEAANPRGVKVPALKHPCEEKHRHDSRRDNTVSTNRTRIGAKAKANPDLVFTSLYHHVADVDNLRECYRALDDNKAIGIDDVTAGKPGGNREHKHLPVASGVPSLLDKYSAESQLLCTTWFAR